MAQRASRWLVVVLLVAGMAGVFGAQVAGATGQQYYALTVLPMPAGTDGWLLGVGGMDDAGDIVAGAADTGNFQHVLVWRHGAGTAIQPADYGKAQYLTHDGVFLYWNLHDGRLHQYNVASGTDSTAVSALSSVTAMNAANPRLTVGTYFGENSQLLSAGKAPLGSTNTHEIQDVGFGISAGALAVNDAGDVAGYGPCATSSSCAYVYDHATGSVTLIGPPADADASATMQATGINAAGEVIGQGWFNSGSYRPPFIYTRSGGLTFLGTGTSGQGGAGAINSAGDVVGEVNGIGAVLWPSGSTDPIDLNTRVAPTGLTGWHLDAAAGINDQGLIAANGTLNGQTRAFLLTPVDDATPPTSTATVVDVGGAVVQPNAAGWFTAATLYLHLRVDDNAGGLGLGTLAVNVNGNTSTYNLNRNGQAFDPLAFTEGTSNVSYYATDLAGNTEATHTLTVKYDKSAPTWSCDQAPSGWQRGNVQLECTASDNASGVAGLGGHFTLATSVADGVETANAATNAVQVCDVAGNCAPAQITGLMIDNRAPLIDCDDPGSGWHAADVTVHCSTSDDGAGLADPADAHFTFGTGVGAGVETTTASTPSRTVCDAVGNCVMAGPFANLKIDTKAPAVACDASEGAWHADNVTVHCSASDGGAGLDNPSDAGFSVNTNVAEGTETSAAETNAHEVCDALGNCTTAQVSGFKVDRKAPDITISSPENMQYVVGQHVTASYGCDDAGSGLVSCAGTIANGATLDTATAGSKTFAVSARDIADNTSSQSVSYEVAYNVCLHYDSSKAVKSGSTVSIKLELCDQQGQNLSSAGLTLHAIAVQSAGGAQSAAMDAGNANAGQTFRFTGGKYIYNLKTAGLAAGQYVLVFQVGNDMIQYNAPFTVR